MSLGILNPLKCGEIVQIFRSFTGNSERFSYSPTIVDTHVCTFFDGVLEEMLERNLSVRRRKTRKTQQIIIKSDEIIGNTGDNKIIICSSRKTDTEGLHVC